MGKLVVNTFVTLDGVMQAPGGPDEDRSGGFTHGGWLAPYFDEEGGAFVGEVFERVEAFLLGRRTYDIFSAYWPQHADENDPIASRLNALPKYVASRTLERADWQNSTVIRDVPEEVAALKERPGGELQVHGSGNLVQTLIEHDLVDAYNVLTFPVVLGTGKRLFAGGTVPAALRLTTSQVSTTGVFIGAYRPAGPIRTGSFALAPPTEAEVARGARASNGI